MDVATIDQQYQQLHSQAEQTVQQITQLAGKLQGAAQGGNQDAREWLLDLREVALAIQAEQNQVGALLQALHGFVANQAQAMVPAAPQASPWGGQPAPQPAYPPQGYAPQGGYPPPGYGAPSGGVGGMLGSFLNSGFGRAIEMGAGFGLGEDVINRIF